MPVPTFKKLPAASVTNEGPPFPTFVQQLKDQVTQQNAELTKMMHELSSDSNAAAVLATTRASCACGLLHHEQRCLAASMSPPAVHTGSVAQIARGNRQDDTCAATTAAHFLP